MNMTDEEKIIWDTYFAEIAGWTIHPGYLRNEGKDKLTLEKCADIADEMIMIRRQRRCKDCGEGEK